MRTVIFTLATVLAASGALAGCGRSPEESGLIAPSDLPGPPGLVQGDAATPALTATKNTRRLNADTPGSTAVAAVLATFPATSPASRPSVVALADARDWHAALAATALMGPSLRAPLLFSQDGDLDDLAKATLDRLAPAGSAAVRGAQIIRVGPVAKPKGLRTTDIAAAANDPAAMAAAIDRFVTAARGSASRRVLVVSADDPAFALPAGAWAAKSGDPILFVSRNAVPAATTAALQARRKPEILLLGPSKAISDRVEQTLRALGEVTRIEGDDPTQSAISFARFAKDGSGWGITDPGHGLVFARRDDPMSAIAAASLSAAGTYGPLLLLDGPVGLPLPLREYLLDIQPGYEDDPVRGVYNSGWIVGTEALISTPLQAELDGLLEIVKIKTDTTPTSPPIPDTPSTTTTQRPTPTSTP